MSEKKRQIREQFRSECLKRDNFRCVFCNASNNLDVHHITDRSLMPNGGYVKANGITLCEIHHLQAEEFHITGGKSFVPGMSPEELYCVIGSSYENAYKESERL